VEHSYASSVQVARWRTATIVASALAILELAMLGTIGVTHLARSVSHDVQAAALTTVAGPSPAKTETGSKAPVLPRSETGVLVLNGNGVAGAAAVAADRVRSLGYIVSGVGNAETQGSTTTLVMYRGKHRAEAQRLARDVHATVVTPLDGMRPAELMGGQLALVLGG
jgi:hypothetical protein